MINQSNQIKKGLKIVNISCGTFNMLEMRGQVEHVALWDTPYNELFCLQILANLHYKSSGYMVHTQNLHTVHSINNI